MAATYREFLIGLYQEHLEDASFLFEQRRHLLTDQELSWLRLEEFEERLEAHLDGLVIGGDLAVDTCHSRATEGDAGELFAAVCVFCRRKQAPLLADVLKTLDHDDPEKTRAVTDALKYELPVEWREDRLRAVADGDRRLAPVLAPVLGYRRLPANDVLLHSVRDAAPGALPSLLWSLGRTGGGRAVPVVRSLLQADDEATAAAALRAALRLQDGEAFDDLVRSAGTTGADPIPLGLAGGRRMARVLLAALKDSDRSLDAVTGLGLLGDLSAVRPLLDLLADETLAGAAAEALHVITGASLFEDVVIPEEVTEDEMFPAELTAFRERGEAPRRPDGQPFGTKVRRLARDPATWNEWLTANSSSFVAGRRYRNGVLCTPQVLLDCLRSEIFPKSYRYWIGEELLIRYGIDLPFEPDMLVAQQRRVLKEATARIAAAAASFEPGEWYFAGQPIS